MTRRHSRDDPRENVSENVGVGVGVVEFQLYIVHHRVYRTTLTAYPVSTLKWRSHSGQRSATLVYEY